MKFKIEKLTQENALWIADEWKYEGEYAFYDMTADLEDYEEFIDETKRESNDYFEVTNEIDNKCIGFFCLFKDDDSIEIGLGLRPDYCGKGYGKDFLNLILEYIENHYEYNECTVCVAKFNQRAKKLYENCGFIVEKEYLQKTNGGEYDFYLMRKQRKSKSELDKMLSGELYNSLILEEKRKQMLENKNTFLDNFNNTGFGEFEKREELIRKVFKKVGKNCIINKPFYCDYGCNISVGDNFYANFDCVFLDVNKITIGNNVFLAPRVCIYIAGHPIDKDIRNQYLEYGKEITIGNDVWIGGNTIINPGVTIGNNVVIGSGSVVTKDIPSDVIAFGNPCKVYRKITLEDKKYWEDKVKGV